MKRFLKTGWILICFFMLSCEKNIELSIDLPKASVVLNAFLSADSMITATVSRTVRDIYDNNPDSLPSYFPYKTSIEVFANDVKQGVMEKEKDGRYRLPGYYPSVGDRIRMEVQADGFDPLSAEVSIPSQPCILSVDTQMYKETSTSYYLGENMIDVKLRFKEPENETNYYMLALEGYGINKKDTLTKINLPVFVAHNEDLLFEKLEPVYFFDSSFADSYDTSFFIFNDKAITTGEYTLKFTLNNVLGSYDSDSLSFVSACRMYLYSISESYYLYYRSKLLQWKQKEDPFGSVGLREPVPTYTNVRNGYGLLSARQAAIYEFKVAPGMSPPEYYNVYSLPDADFNIFTPEDGE
ncbi:MAG: DUF4249 domain-containing protein [Tannerellaceae bacterium]|jgi:hypothetical protein|nr:DUF4249 domain-containing protein [Tannerellaceae bacterium]